METEERLVYSLPKMYKCGGNNLKIKGFRHLEKAIQNIRPYTPASGLIVEMDKEYYHKYFLPDVEVYINKKIADYFRKSPVLVLGSPLKVHKISGGYFLKIYKRE